MVVVGGHSNLVIFFLLRTYVTYKFAYVNILPAGVLRFLMGKMVPVPSMRSCLGRFLPMPSGIRRLNSLAVLRSQLGGSGPFRCFWSDGCFPALIFVVLMDVMLWAYFSCNDD